jgi:RNA polymerase sigma-70 factor (ECF subfamily)
MVKPSVSEAGAGPSDAALVVAARAGERWAQEALFRRHARMVNGLAFRLMGRNEDMDDLVQDSFLAAFRGLDGLVNPQAFSSWLGSIVVRTAHKLLRRQRLMNRLGLRRNTPLDLEALIASGAPPGIAAELAQVYRCLERLAPHARIALVLHRVDGLSLPDVAAQMKISLSTVKRRIKDAEKHLAEMGGSKP